MQLFSWAGYLDGLSYDANLGLWGDDVELSAYSYPVPKAGLPERSLSSAAIP